MNRASLPFQRIVWFKASIVCMSVGSWIGLVYISRLVGWMVGLLPNVYRGMFDTLFCVYLV